MRRALLTRGAARAAYATEVLTDSPLLYWRLGESSGTTAADASGNGMTGTYSGTYTLSQPGLLAGDPNTSVLFAAGLVTVADSTDLTAFTAEAWISTHDTGADIATRRGSTVGSDIFELWLNGGNAQIDVWSGAGTRVFVAGASALTDDLPHHVVGTYDGTTIRLYVDGVQVGTPSTAISGALRTVNTAFVAAGAGTFPTFTGLVDEVAYYDHALTGARVAAHYAAGI